MMATCAAVGQAVGTAAAMCVERGIAPRQLSASSDLVASLQQRLLRQDQSIRGVPARDPGDLARTARVRASAESGEARAVLRGALLPSGLLIRRIHAARARRC